MIGSARLLENGVCVKLRVRRGIISAVEKLFIGFLFAMVWKPLPGDLTARQAATVGKSGQENGINRPALLQNIEHLRRSFIEEGHRSNLEADHFFGRRLG